MTIQDYCNKELNMLKKVGDKCELAGHIGTIRNCVKRYAKRSNLVFSTKEINEKLHVIVMESKG